MASSFKIQGSADEYTMFVINGLIGINGKTKADVVTTLLRLWMHDNADYLKECGLSVKDWKNSTKK